MEFEAKADSPEVEEFILKQAQRFWDRGVPKLQGGYEYGWIGCEDLYANEDNYFVWDQMRQFSPRDTFLLTQDYHGVGVRVKNVKPVGEVDLSFGSADVPAKGLWYPHEPRYNQHYGTSQLLGAWRPWRRLAWKDGAESVVDVGVYRFGVRGPVVRYPPDDPQTAQTGIPGTVLDSEGNPRRYNRDVARQLAELYKAGAGIGMSSATWPPDMGGGLKWDIDLAESTLNVDGLLNYVRHLWDQIHHGIGVPPELLQASEGGSGYSGRKIPREAFLMRQQRIADAILDLFVRQILRPLVHWNFGAVKFTIAVKNILMTERKAQTGQDEEGALQQGTQAPGAPSNGQTGLPTQQSQGGGWDGRGFPPTSPTDTKLFSLTPEQRVKEVRRIAETILRRAA